PSASKNGRSEGKEPGFSPALLFVPKDQGSLASLGMTASRSGMTASRSAHGLHRREPRRPDRRIHPEDERQRERSRPCDDETDGIHYEAVGELRRERLAQDRSRNRPGERSDRGEHERFEQELDEDLVVGSAHRLAQTDLI